MAPKKNKTMSLHWEPKTNDMVNYFAIKTDEYLINQNMVDGDVILGMSPGGYELASDHKAPDFYIWFNTTPASTSPPSGGRNDSTMNLLLS